ncbi:hypothetical protein [Candidatus Tisiphia endosymbiont of Micropterix aruncella]
MLCLSKAIKKLEEEIAELTTDEKTVEQLEVLETVPGIGKVVSKVLLAFLPEIGKVDRR